ncbi:SPOR domain-containing protein [Georgenia sp. 10Sc9-8]|uniref:SPOR domain-containing protein n=1 Tax=Georgenia halotolerans TaxID=3028317 RepID=A0ABT5TXZ7_9MICO|nr:SPOR domain-containing protein [Georgenia halotolerans]
MSEEKYYYNLATGEVEHGKITDMSTRMGPYETAEEAAAAMSRVQERNESWAQEDERWEKG